MLQYILITVILLHGLLHCIGFAKAFGLADLPQLTRPVTKPIGLLWLITALLFIAAAILLLLKKDSWWMLVLPALIFSEVLIVTVWQDAKFGTIANIIILAAVLLVVGSTRFENSWKGDAGQFLPHKSALTGLDAGAELQPLPFQRYHRYPCALNDMCLLAPATGSHLSLALAAHQYSDSSGSISQLSNPNVPAGFCR